MDRELLDLDLGPEPPTVAPEVRLYAGRRALRRRRLASGVGVTAAALAISGVGWGVAGLGAATDDDQPFASGPSPRAVTELPVVAPDDCLGEVCVELVPQGMEPLSPGKPGGDMALGYRDGELVRFRPDVTVISAIEDPTGTGATESAAVEVEFRGIRFRVALASGFGYLVDEVDDGEEPSLTEWFAQQHAVPANDCSVQAPRGELGRADVPGPHECWVEVDGDRDVVAADGVKVTDSFTASVPGGVLPPGVVVTGVAFTRDDTDWFAVVRQIGKAQFVSSTLARVQDLPNGTTLVKWAAETAPETSVTGIPAGAGPRPYETLNWWHPATGTFTVPDGATVVRKVENPLGRKDPDGSAGLVFDFDGERYWALTEVKTARDGGPEDQTSDGVHVRAGGVSISEVHGARGAEDFDAWLAAAVAERKRIDAETSTP